MTEKVREQCSDCCNVVHTLEWDLQLYLLESWLTRPFCSVWSLGASTRHCTVRIWNNVRRNELTDPFVSKILTKYVVVVHYKTWTTSGARWWRRNDTPLLIAISILGDNSRPRGKWDRLWLSYSRLIVSIWLSIQFRFRHIDDVNFSASMT